MSARRSIPALLGAAIALVLAPGSASATTYCVSDAACVGDHSNATISDAVTDANLNGGADTVQVGAGTFTLAGTVQSNIAQPITFRGRGTGVTRIVAPVNVPGLTLYGTDVTASDFTIESANVDTGFDDIPFRVFADNLGIVTLSDIKVMGTGRYGASISGQGTVTRFDVAMPTYFGSGSGVALGANPGTGKSLTMTDMEIAGMVGIAHQNGGTLTLNRTQVLAATQGIWSYTFGQAAQTTRMSSVLVRMAPVAPGAIAISRAIQFETRGSNAAVSTGSLIVFDTTVAAAPTGSKATTAIGLDAEGSTSGAFNGVGSTTVDGMIMAGPFDTTVRTLTDGGTSTMTAEVRNSIYDLTKQSIGAAPLTPASDNTANRRNIDPQFVDAANFDFRLRWGSPAIDTGSLGASPWEVGSSRVDLQACKLEYSIVSPK